MKKSTIICVDDEKVVLTSLKSQLRKSFENVVIETAESAEEALEIIEEALQHNIELPVIISDHIMPGMKGDEFLEIVHSKSKKTLSILLTGQADADAVGRALNKAKLYRYISKPWEETDLSLTVKEAIRSYFQDVTIEEQNRQLEAMVLQLKEYNETLEEKVIERTKEVNHQKEIIEERNKRITDSINYAQRIQQALLTPHEILNNHYPENFILYKPRDIVSGDFYWVKQIKNILYVAAADCTGHGVPGAFMSMLGISLLNEIVSKRDVNPPNVILNELRKRIKNMLHQTGEANETKDGMDIAFCSFDKENKIIQFAGAHNPLWLIRNSSTSEFFEYKADRMPIGIHPKDTIEFTNHDIKVMTGDRVYLFSDGYSSQFGGSDGEKFKSKRLHEAILKMQNLPMKEQLNFLNNTFYNWKQLNEQVDDILIIGIEI